MSLMTKHVRPVDPPEDEETKGTVTVCADCLRAACWQGVLMCDGARGADTVEKTLDELRALGLEPESWWWESGTERTPR